MFWVGQQKTMVFLNSDRAASIGCFHCQSINGSNPRCHDPFNSTGFFQDYWDFFTNGDHNIPDLLQKPGGVYLRYCMTSMFSIKKNRSGPYPGTACVKVKGTFRESKYLFCGYLWTFLDRWYWRGVGRPHLHRRRGRRPLRFRVDQSSAFWRVFQLRKRSHHSSAGIRFWYDRYLRWWWLQHRAKSQVRLFKSDLSCADDIVGVLRNIIIWQVYILRSSTSSFAIKKAGLTLPTN